MGYQRSTGFVEMATQSVLWSSPVTTTGGKAAVWSGNAASFDLVVNAT